MTMYGVEMTTHQTALMRMAVKQRLLDWGLVTGGGFSHLAGSDHATSLYLSQLFGYEKYADFCEATNDDPVLLNRVRAILGDNGYTLVKAMKARSDG